MDSTRKERIAAAVITAVVTAVALIVLFAVVLTFPPRDWEERHPAEEESELLFGGEYVMLGDLPVPSASDAVKRSDAAPDGADLSDAGAAAEAPAVVTSDAPAAMEVPAKPEQPEKTGPTKEEIEQAEARRRVGSRMNFSSSSADNTSAGGQTGSPNGNAESGAVSGQPGHNLRGRRLLNRVTPADRNATGTVEVAITVDRDGKVTSARAVGGTPTASSSASVRKGCVDASLRLRFSASADAPASQSGTVVWRFD